MYGLEFSDSRPRSRTSHVNTRFTKPMPFFTSIPNAPMCRMIRRVAELDKIDNFIDRVGDVQLWLELVHYISLFTGGMRQFRSAVRGGSVRNQFFVSFGENGNGESHRHAKNRMHNLVTDSGS